jgi:protein tyrosine phosphatase
MEFIHIQYTGWPDFGAPTETAPIISLIKDVRKMIEATKKSEMINILVHCSAGVGRTGTLITLYKMMEEIEELLPKAEEEGDSSNLSIDIFNTVFNFRSKRMYMVSKMF